jgi:hypothetical protein
MPKPSDASDITRREFLVGAGTAVTTGYLVIGGPSSAATDPPFPPPPTDHEMTFDVTQNPLACGVDSQPATQLCRLTVNKGEKVHFKAITVAKGKRHLAVLFTDKTPFVDKDGDPVWAFHGSEGDEGNGIGKDAVITSNPLMKPGDTFEFYVGVWDEDNANKTKTYTRDPTIIIGRGGTPIVIAIAKLSAAVGLIKKAEEFYPDPGIEAIEKQITLLIDKFRTIQDQTK